MGQSRGGTTAREIASNTGAVFEVERFEWADDGRIELQGAWSNVRGTRFVRPALELDAGGTRHRLLALLDHKPWAPGDNGRWQAAFTWDGHVDDVEAAQLTVAPGIVIELPVARPAGNSTKARAAAPMKRRPRRAAPSERARAAAPKSSATKSSATKADTPSDDATQQLDGSAPADSPEVTALRRDLEAALERADAAEQRIAPLERERDAAVAQRRAAAAELEAVRHAHQLELNRARAEERDKAAAALSEGAELRARMERERDDAVAQREIAYRERGAALAEKTDALEQRKQALADRKAALRDRDKADRERDKALRQAARGLDARDRAFEERDRATAERELAVNERDAVVSAYERGLPVRPPRPRYLAEDGREQTELDVWMPRAVALLVVGVFLIVVLRLFLG